MYYNRVETVDAETNKTVGGYVSIMYALQLKWLGLSQEATAEELWEAIQKTKNKNAIRCYRIMAGLVDIPRPEIYVNNPGKYYCLYTAEAFFEILDDFEELDTLVREGSNGRYFLIYRGFEVPDEVIAYRDDNQIVISAQDYEKYRKKEDFIKLSELDMVFGW